MDMFGNMLEALFVEEYRQMKEELRDLKEKVASLESDRDEYGCIDMHETCDAVCVSVASPYSLKDNGFHGQYVQALKDAREMDDGKLLEWASEEYRGKGYYSPLRPISVNEHKFQYTLKFRESRGTSVFVTDGTDRKELVDIDKWSPDMRDNFERWCRAERLDELMDAALVKLRENISEAIKMVEGDDKESNTEQ